MPLGPAPGGVGGSHGSGVATTADAAVTVVAAAAAEGGDGRSAVGRFRTLSARELRDATRISSMLRLAATESVTRSPGGPPRRLADGGGITESERMTSVGPPTPAAMAQGGHVIAAVGEASSCGSQCGSSFDGAHSSPIAVAAAAVPQLTSAPRGLQVLIVDDDRVNRRLLERNLRGQEHKGRVGAIAVDAAVHGRAALDLIDSAAAAGWAYDVVFMDLEMPVMRGEETVREIRMREAAAAAAGAARPPLCVVATTAHDVASVAHDCARAGFTATLSKPIGHSDVACILDDCVRVDDGS